MSEFSNFLNRKAAIEVQISEERFRYRKKVLSEILVAIEEFRFVPDEVFSSREKRKIRPLYFNPKTGETWSGRGKEPLWIRGKDRRMFELESDSPEIE
ncbi:H-NS histone family protein [Burkholderia territorii]|uniref:H-NS histone family protein n=1 Tax=Burkholderia territorii TaxID=1503055 RepID=UPI0009BD45CB|nr:H-NS histone family protein [Burkholderia territorii]